MSEEATTVFAQSPSGSINKVDIPTDSHARLRFDHAIEIGDITIIPDAEIVEVGNLVDGLKYVRATPSDDPAPAAEVEADDQADDEADDQADDEEALLADLIAAEEADAALAAADDIVSSD